LASLSARLSACITRSSDRKRDKLRALSRALPSADQLLALPRRRFDEAAGRISRALVVAVERKATRLATARLSPAALARQLDHARQKVKREAEQLPKAFAALRRSRRTELSQAGSRLRIDRISARLEQARTGLGHAARRGDG